MVVGKGFVVLELQFSKCQSEFLEGKVIGCDFEMWKNRLAICVWKFLVVNLRRVLFDSLLSVIGG